MCSATSTFFFWVFGERGVDSFHSETPSGSRTGSASRPRPSRRRSTKPRASAPARRPKRGTLSLSLSLSSSASGMGASRVYFAVWPRRSRGGDVDRHIPVRERLLVLFLHRLGANLRPQTRHRALRSVPDTIVSIAFKRKRKRGEKNGRRWRHTPLRNPPKVGAAAMMSAGCLLRSGVGLPRAPPESFKLIGV